MVVDQPDGGRLDRLSLTRRVVTAASDALIVAGIGNAGFDLATAGDRPENFYMLGSMGLGVPIGHGLALAQPERPVVVLEGEVSIRRNGRKVATLGPGAMVGELSLLDHGPRTATAVCETDCLLLVIDQRHFRAVLEDVPSMSVKLLASLAGRIRDLDRQYYG